MPVFSLSEAFQAGYPAPPVPQEGVKLVDLCVKAVFDHAPVSQVCGRIFNYRSFQERDDIFTGAKQALQLDQVGSGGIFQDLLQSGQPRQSAFQYHQLFGTGRAAGDPAHQPLQITDALQLLGQAFPQHGIIVQLFYCQMPSGNRFL